MPTDPAAYDAVPDLGLLYDAVAGYSTRPDVAFYVREAERSGGPVLELGCGTGRILIPMARAGCTVAGLDGSREMLARCEAKLRDEPAEVRARATLHHGDARDFDLGATFGLVTAPFRLMQQVVTIDEQLGLLGSVRRHLAPGGRFVFDVYNPSFAALAAADGAEHEDTPERPLPDGRTLRRAVRIPRVRWVDQVSETELVYYLAPAPGAPAERYVQAFDMRWYVRAELVHLLGRGGFRVTAIDGDFDGAPLAGSPEMVVHAQALLSAMPSPPLPPPGPAPDPRLAERVEERVRGWGVAVERTLETESSVVAFGTRGGEPVVLKVVRREGDEWRSGEVLQAFGGRGMVRVHAHVPGAVLLERLDPGTPLAEMALGGDDDEATAILAEVIARISSPDSDLHPFVSIEDWGTAFDQYLAGGDRQLPRALVEEARRVFAELCARQRGVRLLHGDLQHYNVLFDRRRGWVAIDPKGVLGEPEYEIGAALRNPDEPELFAVRATVERRVRRYADALGMDPQRILAWSFANAVLSAVWGIEDGFAVDAEAPPLRLARVLRPMLG
jgi:streptomycin 6-kinase